MRSLAHWSLLVLTAGVLAVVGCKSGGQTPRDGDITGASGSGGTGNPDAPATSDAVTSLDSNPTSDSATGLTPTAACRASIEAQCRRQVACRGGTVDACTETVINRCPDYYFNPRSLRTPAEIESCLAALGSMTCTDIAMSLVPPCLRSGTGAAGGACLYSTECEFGCSGFSDCGTCYSGNHAATGQACDSTHRCDPTDYCHTVSKTCIPKASVVHAAEGDPCDFTAQPPVGCQGDLVCARTTTTGTAGVCRPFPQLDQPCASSGDTIGGQSGLVCAAGLGCNTQTMTCRPVSPSTGGCGDGGACDDASFCRGAFGPNATCAPRASVGQACRNYDSAAGLETQCTLGLQCVLAPDAGSEGTCVKPGALGDACDKARPCDYSVLCSAGGRCAAIGVAACQP